MARRAGYTDPVGRSGRDDRSERRRSPSPAGGALALDADPTKLYVPAAPAADPDPETRSLDLEPAWVDLLPGTLVGEYRVEGKIGAGGMGVVYAAVHPVLLRRVAIKVSRRTAKPSAATVSANSMQPALSNSSLALTMTR